MTPYYSDDWLTVYQGDCREVLASMEPESVHCVVTSPPYWGLRDYGDTGQLGLEPTPELYVENMVAVFREVKRVLRSDGTLWLNLGDSYASTGGHTKQGATSQRQGRSNVEVQHVVKGVTVEGLAQKQLVGIPWRVAFALQADGWYLRSDIIWAKPNPMPESVTDRPTKSHEYLFLLTKSARYWFDAESVRLPISPYNDGRVSVAPHGAHVLGSGHRQNEVRSYDEIKGANIRTVWTIATQPYPEAHFATFPPKLVEPCIKAGCPTLGTVLDPFAGSGTTGLVAQSLSRRAVLIDLNAEYLRQAMRRNNQSPLGLETA